MPESKKRALSSEEAAACFRDGLFDTAEQQKYTGEYAKSSPYVYGNDMFEWLSTNII
jgi:hypothetical protein